MTRAEIITLRTTAGVFRLRPETAGDQSFLFTLFRSHALTELAAMPVDDATRDALVRMQFQAQTAGYRGQFPDARFDVVEQEGSPIGRLIVDEGEAFGCIVDFALIPDHRGRGIGAAILSGILDRFAPVGRPMRCKVLSHNEASIRMCRRVGFQQIDEQPPFLQLEWRPT